MHRAVVAEMKVLARCERHDFLDFPRFLMKSMI